MQEIKKCPLEDWLVLAKAPELSSITITRLLEHYKSPTEILRLSRLQLGKLNLKSATIDYLKKRELADIKQDIEWNGRENHHIVTLDNPLYPKLLKQIADPQVLLYVKGNVSILNQPQIAIVGSRNPSFMGRELAFEFAHELAKIGLTITSGMAIGIDTTSHQGALQANGNTIAVLGSGLNYIYPKSNRKLAEDISKNGAVISEFSLFSAPAKGHFPRRNRTISGLSLGTLVVEAAPRSGSLITAKFALEQSREVFAIPGSIRHPLAKGCHRLIKQGAILVEKVADILAELQPQLNEYIDKTNIKTIGSEMTKESCGLELKHKKLLDCVGFEPTSFDHVLLRSGLNTIETSTILLILELNGYINATASGYMRVK